MGYAEKTIAKEKINARENKDRIEMQR